MLPLELHKQVAKYLRSIQTALELQKPCRNVLFECLSKACLRIVILCTRSQPTSFPLPQQRKNMVRQEMKEDAEGINLIVRRR